MTDKNGRFVLSYDNARSIGLKCDYILENELLGAMFWDDAGDDSNDTLHKTIANPPNQVLRVMKREDELASIAAGRSPESVQQEAEEAARKAEEARNPEPVDTTPQISGEKVAYMSGTSDMQFDTSIPGYPHGGHSARTGRIPALW